MSPKTDILAFHRSLPGYRPTPLVDARRTAARLGVARLWVKDESHRFDLGAYKILGASWAASCAVKGGASPELVAASEGNHGRAVARAARWLGLRARIFVPKTASPERIAKIDAEGAEVAAVDGDYDDAVVVAARFAEGGGRVFLSDTGLTGDEESPRRVVEGYSTLFGEIDDLEPRPDFVFVQMGVGALAAAAVRHYPKAQVIGVEPEGANCIGQSIAAGRLLETHGPYDPRMAGLNCGRPSSSALPILARGLAGCVAVPPSLAAAAVAWLAEEEILSTPTGAAGLAGAALYAPKGKVLVIATEGKPNADLQT